MIRHYGAGVGLAWVGLALLAWLPQTAAARQQPDEISRLLFREYLDGPRKINSSAIMAASHLVAERGRASGFWKDVLAELRSGDEHSEVHCVRILGNMLATDAAARDAIRRQRETGEIGASIQAAYLGPEVVAELLARGGQADRNRVDHYAIALARARVPEAKDFLAGLLVARRAQPPIAGADAPSGPQHLDSTRFHAAVGLAQLGDPQAVEWLIAHCDEINGHVEHTRPYGASRGGNLGSCCVAALQQLSGERSLATRAEWEAWWKTASRKGLQLAPVQMADGGGAY